MPRCAIAAMVALVLALGLRMNSACAQDDDAGAGDDDAGVGASAELCSSDAECDTGLVCRAELGNYCGEDGGDLACISESPRCLPPPLYCETDAACPPGLGCAPDVATQCRVDPSLPGGCVTRPIGPCMAGAPESTAGGRYASFETDGDCDPGYVCRAEGGSICAASRATGCVPSGPLLCIAEGTPRKTDRDCPSSWICAELQVQPIRVIDLRQRAARHLRANLRELLGGPGAVRGRRHPAVGAHRPDPAAHHGWRCRRRRQLMCLLRPRRGFRGPPGHAPRLSRPAHHRHPEQS